MINQVLACPKCSNMVRVIPPADLKLDEETVPSLPPQVNRPEDKVTDDGDFSNFDDIDDVIAKGQSAPEQPSIPAPPKRSRKPSLQKQVAATASPEPQANNNEPMLPNQNWASNKSKQRQKLILAIAGGLGILLLTIGGVVAFVINSGKTETVQNDNNADKTEVAEQVDKPTETPQEHANDPATMKTPQETETPNTESTDPPSKAETKTQTDVKTPTDNPPENGSTSLNDPLTGLTEPETPLVSPDQTPEKKTQDDEENPLGLMDPLANLDGQRVKDPINGGSIDGSTEISTRLGELNDLLSDSGMSLSSVQDVADANRRLLLGRSKYYFEFPDPPKVNLAKTLSNRLSGSQYTDVPLRSFLEDSSNLLGVPISLHVESIQAAGLDFHSKVNFIDRDQNVSDSIDKALETLNMKKEVFEDSLQVVVLADGWNDMKEVTYQPHQLTDTSAASYAALVRRVRGMFSEEAWTDQSVIEMKGNELLVKQVPQVQYQIGRLFEKLKATQALNANPDDQAANVLLATEWTQSEEARKRELTFKTEPDISLKSFVSKIEQQANVTILVDWNSLAQDKWWPGTKVPGEFNEATVQDALHQLGRSMKIGYRAINENTFELLSNTELDRRPELQVYPVKPILSGALTAESLLETLGRTFQKDGGLVQVGFDVDSQAVIVIAPQYIQTQFEAVLVRLRKGS
jgi:hypothetical protein